MKANEDLSGPYESWSTAPPLPLPLTTRQLRVRAATAILVGLSLLIGAVVAMLMVSSHLAPVWHRLSGWFLVLPLILALLGMALISLATRDRWRPRPAMLSVGLVLMLGLGLAPFVLILLYANQAFDTSVPACSAYTVASKKSWTTRGGGMAHSASFSRDGQVVATVRVSRQQFALLSEAEVAWVEVADGFFGIQYMNQIHSTEQACTGVGRAI